VLHHVLGSVVAFRAYAVQYQFDQAERQLALLRMLTSHFPNTNLQVSLAELEVLLTQCKERKAEAQRDVDQKLAAAKQEAVQKVQKEMEQKLEQLKAQLATAQTQMRSNQSDQNITISINVKLG
jgi:DNA-binding transcriptional MerR regulator